MDVAPTANTNRTREGRQRNGFKRGRFEITRNDGISAAAAVIVGLFGAICYYSETLRPLAHTYEIWLLLVALVAARTTPLRGAMRGALSLVFSVVAFYYSKQALYDIIYSSDGFPYRVHAQELLLWGSLGLVGGAGLGVVASRIGRPGWLAAGSTAVVAALLIVDGYDRWDSYREILPLAIAVIGITLVVAVGERTWRQLIRTGYLLVPALLGVSLILNVPDWIQRVLRL